MDTANPKVLELKDRLLAGIEQAVEDKIPVILITGMLQSLAFALTHFTSQSEDSDFPMPEGILKPGLQEPGK